MSKFKVGDRVQMPGVPFVVEVLEIGTCRDVPDCDLGGEWRPDRVAHAVGASTKVAAEYQRLSVESDEFEKVA